MTERQKQLFTELTSSYLETGEPVASLYLAKRGTADVSSATIRNEMAELEAMGYVEQPHTSAGRIPTIKGLRYYLDSIVNPESISKRERDQLERIVASDGLRGLAKSIASTCHVASILVRGAEMYVTGFSEVLSPSYYSDIDHMRAVGKALDSFESAIPHFLSETPAHSYRAFLGNDTHLGRECSVLCTKGGRRGETSLLAMIAPIRTNYAKNFGVLLAINGYL